MRQNSKLFPYRGETRAILPAGGITIVRANECKAAAHVPQGQEADSPSAAHLLV